MRDAALATAAPSLIPLACALLRGEAPAWPSEVPPRNFHTFLAAVRYHGVTPLLDWAYVSSSGQRMWPEAIHQACHDDAIAQAMHELATRAETTRILAALGRAQITTLLMKGAGLAYSHYPTPVLRPRADCDLLVAPSQRDAAWRILQDLGYRRVSGPAGACLGYQLELNYEDHLGVKHNVDLHWRISNAQSFAWLFTFEELRVASMPVPALDSRAVRLGDVHALILAVLHRAGNNQFVESGFGDRLIWLYDIKLLVETMTDEDLARFRRSVEEKHIVAIAIEGLQSCADYLGSSRVKALLRELGSSICAGSGARFLGAGKLSREWLELCAIPTSSARLTYLANRLFPSPTYMRERFPDSTGRPLPALHARRWLEGLNRRLFSRAR